MPRIIKPVGKGDIALPTIQVDSSGRIFSASAGSAGGGNMVLESITSSSGNYQSPANVNTISIYLSGGGGGRGGQTSGRQGGNGGNGGYGLFAVPVDASTTYPFTIGGGGNGGNGSQNSANPGNAGGQSTFGNLATANAGNGGVGPPVNGNSPGGNSGSVPGSTFDLTNRREWFGINSGGQGGTGGGPGAPGPSGQSGQLMLFTNKLS